MRLALTTVVLDEAGPDYLVLGEPGCANWTGRYVLFSSWQLRDRAYERLHDYAVQSLIQPLLMLICHPSDEFASLHYNVRILCYRILFVTRTAIIMNSHVYPSLIIITIFSWTIFISSVLCLHVVIPSCLPYTLITISLVYFNTRKKTTTFRTITNLITTVSTIANNSSFNEKSYIFTTN